MSAGTGHVAANFVVRRRDGFVLDVALQLRGGETTALLGPNGAGKSTALDALAGLLRVDGGRIEIGGTVVDDAADDVFVPAARRQVGVVFQDDRLFPHLDVLDNLAFGLRCRGVPRREARRRAATIARSLGIETLAGRRPAELSGGQAQRVAIGRALAPEPALLLLDEPLSAVDVQARGDLRRMLEEHLGGVTAPRLLVTHDPVDAFLLADRVAVLEDGGITQTGTPDEIRQRPATPWAADLVGTNLLRGTARAGVVNVADHVLRIADRTVHGRVVAHIRPNAISLALGPPSGSQRNVWSAVVARTDHLGDRVRVSFDEPVPLTAEVTPAATAELGLAPGRPVWLAVKATEIVVTPDG